MEEPKASSLLNEVMKKFEDVLNNPRHYGPGVDGALMLAVFRGKVVVSLISNIFLDF